MKELNEILSNRITEIEISEGTTVTDLMKDIESINDHTTDLFITVYVKDSDHKDVHYQQFNPDDEIIFKNECPIPTNHNNKNEIESYKYMADYYEKLNNIKVENAVFITVDKVRLLCIINRCTSIPNLENSTSKEFDTWYAKNVGQIYAYAYVKGLYGDKVNIS